MSSRIGGKRQAAATVARLTGATSLLRGWRQRSPQALTILAYHRVLDIGDEDAFEFDVELVSASVAGFERQMRHVREHYVPLTFRDVLDRVENRVPLPRGACVVTFDDGYSDNYENAFPILRRLGIPATMFVSTGYLDSGETFWFDRVAHAVLRTRQPALALGGLPALDLARGTRARRSELVRLLRHLMRVPDRERVRLAQLAIATLLPDAPLRHAASAPMTWDHVSEMSRAGIEFGAHTVSHPVLSMLEPERLRGELRDSKQRIEQVLGQRVEVIAYPVGGRDAFSPEVQSAVRDAGYRLGVSYVPGTERPPQWDPFALRRIHVERYVDAAWFEAMLAAPRFFA